MHTILQRRMVKARLGLEFKQSTRAVRHPNLVGGGIHLPHPEMSRLGCENDSFLEFAQGLLVFYKLSDVHTRTDVAGEVPLRVIARHSLVRKPTILAVISPQSVLRQKRFARIERLRVRLETHLQIVRVHTFSPAVPHFLVQTAAGKLQPRFVKESTELVRV